MLERIFQKYLDHKTVFDLVAAIKKNITRIKAEGLKSSALSFVAAALYERLKQPIILIFNDKEDAAYFHNDIKNITKKEFFLLQSSFKRLAVKNPKINSVALIARTDVINKIVSDKQDFILCTDIDAISEKVFDKKDIEKNKLVLKTGEELSRDFLEEILVEYGFKKVDFVYDPGQYSVRGSIVDIFSFANDYPYRIDFFGDTVESIRTFDIMSQLSVQQTDAVTIIADINTTKPEKSKKISFLEILPENCVFIFADLRYAIQRIDKIKQDTIFDYDDEENTEISASFITSGEMLTAISDKYNIELAANTYFSPQKTITFNTALHPAINKNFELLTQYLKEYTTEGFENYILSDNKKQIDRLNEILFSFKDSYSFEYQIINNIIHSGFIDKDLKIAVFTDHQIFNRYHKYRNRYSEKILGKQALSLRELNTLTPGDYVVHIDHGIGIFGGIEKIEINGKEYEAVRLVYKDKDVVYVSIHSLHKISKYKGKDSTPPKIHKLGSGAWNKLKQKTKSRVKDIAKELIELYAKRLQQKGFAFSADTYLQHALEASFIYEDTPDQQKATQDVKRDMESPVPMDRLVCGDVGFGKTEVAIRAAFKAVTDGKQVAVLVPTTILAFQHYRTFSDRLKEFPVTIDYISRMKKPKEQKQTISELAQGKIDIIIGTHRLVSKDIKFKDLGLLIIDEEHKFGVAIKEKLKKIKINVDTLTLTATPIPRTLQFSLMGARDLSIITTPPPNRYPIITELHTFNEDIIKEAISYEINRNGQVFFIHNRIDNIYEVEAMIQRICPNVRTVVAHGRMDGQTIEKVLINFINEEYDVLIATTIIESGLDIPNANTIIINDAQNFGLSDLHQLRGRVGRSNKKAFCYLLAPPLTMVTPEARRRLQAIEMFAELGSGFNIAMQDLDIRGAGNLLGAEQSGFIADIGYETYKRILNEAILELKEKEYKELFAAEHDNSQTQNAEFLFVSDCNIDTDINAMFPESYVENVSERIKLYRELDAIDNDERLNEFISKLTDRFGNMPKEAENLINIVKLRYEAKKRGIERIVLKQNKMICYFVSNKNSAFYDSPVFKKVLDFVQKNQKKCIFREKNEKLTLIFSDITSSLSAVNTVSSIN